jgi:hypothetical protein
MSNWAIFSMAKWRSGGVAAIGRISWTKKLNHQEFSPVQDTPRNFFNV